METLYGHSEWEKKRSRTYRAGEYKIYKTGGQPGYLCGIDDGIALSKKKHLTAWAWKNRIPLSGNRPGKRNGGTRKWRQSSATLSARESRS